MPLKEVLAKMCPQGWARTLHALHLRWHAVGEEREMNQEQFFLALCCFFAVIRMLLPLNEVS